ncbi:MAG: hypothetical protein KatS3mg008_0593 [Acidimicrobiales bacterium]|nr:MAG: hypothetical protein KatS3mg008_0593 [Acidimicrobiales bacterium]
MYGENPEDVFFYLTIYNENYEQPPRPAGVTDADIVSGMYCFEPAPEGVPQMASILFSGSAQGAARRARDELAEVWGVGVDLWSATSYKALREEALTVERWNRLHPDAEPRIPRVTQLLARSKGPVVAVTDFMKVVPDQIARWLPHGRDLVPLGTDGFGRSDTREALRRFFEVDAAHLVVAVLSTLSRRGEVDPEVALRAIERHGIDTESPDPRICFP